MSYDLKIMAFNFFFDDFHGIAISSDATDATDATRASQTMLRDFVASPANDDLIEKITTKLDERSRVNSCWMDLGRQFQLSGEKIKEIELCGESNPTEALMEYLYAQQQGLTVGTFYEKVKKINRGDVLKKLKPFLDGKFVCIHIFELKHGSQG